MLNLLRTVIFFLEGAIKRSAANVQMPMEKERVQRDKNGNMNNVAFYAISSSSPYGYLSPKLKKKTEVKTQILKSPVSFEHRNKTSVYKTHCHI